MDGDIPEEFIRKGGFKFNYTKIRNAVNRCEVERAEKNKSDECRKAFRELGIEIIE